MQENNSKGERQKKEKENEKKVEDEDQHSTAFLWLLNSFMVNIFSDATFRFLVKPSKLDYRRTFCLWECETPAFLYDSPISKESKPIFNF